MVDVWDLHTHTHTHLKGHLINKVPTNGDLSFDSALTDTGVDVVNEQRLFT